MNFYSGEIQWRRVWNVFEGITAEIDLVEDFKLKIILLRAYFITEVIEPVR